MRLYLTKGEKLVRTFTEGNTPFLDILGFSYSGETDFLTVNFCDETNDSKPQVFQAQFGNHFDCLVMHSGKEVKLP